MFVALQHITKTYNKQVVLNNLSWQIEPGVLYGLTGPNGSGKTTLLRIISGQTTPNEGKVIHKIQEQEIPIDEVYKHISYGAPYIDLFEALSLTEHLSFHAKVVGLSKDWEDKIASQLDFDPNKRIENYSSGMKQKLKMALAIHTPSELLILDEPTTNLDEDTTTWFWNELKQNSDQRTTIICSPNKNDLSQIDQVYDISNLSKAT